MTKNSTYLIAAGLLAFAVRPASAGSYTFQTIDVPGVTDLEIHGSNDRGDYVGVTTTASGQRQGFTLFGGVYSAFSYPGAVRTNFYDVNNLGQAVGIYSDTDGNSHGFMLQNGTATPFDLPGAPDTVLIGINDRGTLAGYSSDTDFFYHSFVQRGTLETFDYPGSSYTFGGAINNLGETGGGYYDADFASHGFVRLPDGTYQSFDIPGAAAVYVNHINDSGVAVLNAYGDDDDLNPHGYVRDAGGALTALNALGAIRTAAWDIDSAGRVAGFFVTADGYSHGYLATPDPVPEASTLASFGLLCLGLAGVAWSARRVRPAPEKEAVRVR